MLRASSIVALATPSGTSALAVIRLSGESVKQVLQTCLSQRDFSPREMKLCAFKDASGETLDHLMFAYFEGPKSFTGEDCLELFPHGNMLVVKSILRAILQIGDFRLAEPGEFSRRSFENGKMDLVQAESIAEMIHSTNESALRNARRLLNGDLSNQVRDLVDEVKFLSAKMELEVDFAEEEADAELEGWKEDVLSIRAKISKMHQGYQKSAIFQSIPRVVFYGKPNAGKSSLINALLEEERLLVSSQAGTTRDYVETRLHLPEGEIVLIDTAGLGEAIDELDERSQEKTREVLVNAHLKVQLCDGTETETPLLEDDAIRLWTKSDSPAFIEREGMALSSISKIGLEGFVAYLRQNLFLDNREEDVWMTSQRQVESLLRADSKLESLKEAIDMAHGPEILAFELQEVRNELQSITGEISPDAILHRIFSGFCIGK